MTVIVRMVSAGFQISHPYIENIVFLNSPYVYLVHNFLVPGCRRWFPHITIGKQRCLATLEYVKWVLLFVIKSFLANYPRGFHCACSWCYSNLCSCLFHSLQVSMSACNKGLSIQDTRRRMRKTESPFPHVERFVFLPH